MTSSLEKILSEQESQSYATKVGLQEHIKMRNICTETNQGDEGIINKIKQNAVLERFFHKDAKTEVPIAGYIDGKFVSRRIDRLYVSEELKTVFILDYKSDTDKKAFYDKYVYQINEYKKLLKEAFKGYSVQGFILWLNDFELQEIN